MSETTTTKRFDCGDRVAVIDGPDAGEVAVVHGVHYTGDESPPTVRAYDISTASNLDRVYEVPAHAVTEPTFPCPGCGADIVPTLDENGGNYRFRCEDCDVEQCSYCGPGVWAHYFRGVDLEGWAHTDNRTCFQNGPAPLPFPTEVSAKTLLSTLAAVVGDRPAFVAQTGGGVATIYVGEPETDEHPYELAIGPGSYDWTDPDASSFSFAELYVGPDDDGETTPATVRTLAQVSEAAMYHLGDLGELPAELAPEAPTVEAPTDDETVVTIPGAVYAHYKDGVITRLEFSPSDPEASAYVWEGDETLDVEDVDGPFWKAMQAALSTATWTQVGGDSVENHVMPIEWTE